MRRLMLGFVLGSIGLSVVVQTGCLITGTRPSPDSFCLMATGGVSGVISALFLGGVLWWFAYRHPPGRGGAA